MGQMMDERAMGSTVIFSSARLAKSITMQGTLTDQEIRDFLSSRELENDVTEMIDLHWAHKNELKMKDCSENHIVDLNKKVDG